MITSVFKKSTLPNIILVVVLLLAFFFLYQTTHEVYSKISFPLLKSSGSILIILLSFFLVNFIAKKNNLTKNSSYIILFFLLFLIVFPSIFINSKLLIANLFILLAVRRLISLQTLNMPKEKIFDASIWIFIASLFYFWAILFLLLVYVSIFFHVSRDFRNWLLPFVAFFATAILFIFFSFLFEKNWITQYINEIQLDFQMPYFSNVLQKGQFLFFGVVGIYFLFTLIFTLTNKPLVLQASYKKMIFYFLIGAALFFISPCKKNEILVFTFMPLSLMCTTNIEYSQSKWYQELLLFLIILGSCFCFYFQL